MRLHDARLTRNLRTEKRAPRVRVNFRVSPRHREKLLESVVSGASEAAGRSAHSCVQMCIFLPKRLFRLSCIIFATVINNYKSTVLVPYQLCMFCQMSSCKLHSYVLLSTQGFKTAEVKLDIFRTTCRSLHKALLHTYTRTTRTHARNSDEEDKRKVTAGEQNILRNEFLSTPAILLQFHNLLKMKFC